jgi:hypothetical protein
MDWEDRLDDGELELELNAQLEGSDWVTLERAATGTGVCRAALRRWYQTGHIPSRLTNGPHGPPRLVPHALGRCPRRGRAAPAPLPPRRIVYLRRPAARCRAC